MATVTAPIASDAPASTVKSGHPALVRVAHWITTFCVLAMLLSGVEILISHPRFYWGEAGNVDMEPWLTLPIPASRGSVKTGYNFVLKDQNHWSRSLHFQSAWLLVFTGLAYAAHGLAKRRFHTNPRSYNALQRRTYLAVVFALVPLLFWTGLAMSPTFVAAFPLTVTSLGGQQSARTIHFFATIALTAFFVGHVVMVYRNGFVRLTRAMITGRADRKEHA